MTRKRLSLLLLTFALIAIPLSPGGIGHAQAGSQTFPETGKTVTGKFLDYWKSHGGLAQQGYPISEEIQETSATDGMIYTVQYFERSVFELHPEKAAPYDVLLQLLGVFYYGQKYGQVQPEEIPNDEPGSIAFEQTGQRLGGVFLNYWRQHGGLAQQGYPISDEFQEKSALDGKTYKVQYFERAVFEYHPEQPAAYQVLLSQLGTFRNKAKYGTVASQLSGTGNRPTVPFSAKAGLAVFQSVRANNGYYYIDLKTPAGNQIATIASGNGPLDLSDAINIPSDGMYTLQVQADGGWTVNVMQPKADYSPPPPTQEWSGHRTQATPLFSLKAGPSTFEVAGTGGTDVFRVDLLGQDGKWLAKLIDTKGNAQASTVVSIPADGVYLIRAQFDGDWMVKVQQ